VRLVPAGTGGTLARFKQIADKRDRLILEERSKQDSEALPAAE
jgi:DNA-directed RNA polymerase subunit beta'